MGNNSSQPVANQENESLIDKNGPIFLENRVSVVLNDEQFAGEKLPKRTGLGPVKNRRLTDALCCVIFVIVFIAYLIVGLLYSMTQKTALMKKPLDSEARTCGVDDSVKDFKYLYMVKFSADYRSVCVKECPKVDYNQIKYNSTGTNTTAIKPVYYEDLGSVLKFTPSITTKKEEKDIFDFDTEAAAGYYTKEQWDAYFSRQTLQCQTNSDVTSCKHNPGDKVYVYDSRLTLDTFCSPITPTMAAYSSFISSRSSGFVHDLQEGFWMIIISIALAAIVAIVFLLLTSTCMLDILIFIQIGLCILFFLALGVLFYVLAFKDLSAALADRKASAETLSRYESLKKQKTWLIVFGTLFFLLAIALLVFTVLMRKKIKGSVSLLKYANKVLVSNPGLILTGLVFFFCQLAIILATIWFLLACYTSGTPKKDPKVGSPLPNFEFGFLGTCGAIFLLVAFYWLLLFFNNMGDYFTAARTADHYFNNGKGLCSTLCEVLLYHTGTVAWASLILLPCSLLKFLFGWIYDLMTSEAHEGKPNCLQAFFSKACICLLYPYKKFIHRISEEGFGLSYITCSDFCPSTKEAYYLQAAFSNNLGSIGLVNTLYRVSAVLFISLANTFIAYLVFSYLPFYSARISNPLNPCIVDGF
jgi:hypothetical protein